MWKKTRKNEMICSTWLPTKSWKRLKHSLDEMKWNHCNLGSPPSTSEENLGTDLWRCVMFSSKTHTTRSWTSTLGQTAVGPSLYQALDEFIEDIYCLFFARASNGLLNWMYLITPQLPVSSTNENLNPIYAYLPAWYRLHYLHDTRYFMLSACSCIDLQV